MTADLATAILDVRREVPQHRREPALARPGGNRTAHSASLHGTFSPAAGNAIARTKASA